jgi:hypothetical protein
VLSSGKSSPLHSPSLSSRSSKRRKKKKKSKSETNLHKLNQSDKKHNSMEELEEEPLATSHRARLKNWFTHLSEEERRSIVSVVDKNFCQLLLNMYEKKCKEGDGLFFDVGGQDLRFALPRTLISFYSLNLTHTPTLSHSN